MIVAMNVAVPKNIVERGGFDPAQLARFEQTTGIAKTRKWDGPDTTSLALAAVEPIRHLLGDVERVIVVTQSPDRLSPCMAVQIAGFIGRQHCMAFDVNQSCCGFVYGLFLGLIGPFKETLVVCVDRLKANGMEALIFSDAACAMLIRRPVDGVDSPTAFKFFNFPDHTSLCSDPQGSLKMDSSAVFDFATVQVPEVIKDFENYTVLCGMPADVLVPHQANLSMTKLIARRSGFSGKTLSSIEDYGNQSMVSIATCIAMHEQQLLGERVMMAGFGAGLSVAMGNIRWPDVAVSSIKEVKGDIW